MHRSLFRTGLITLVLAAMFVGCTKEEPQLVIVSKKLKSEKEVNTAVPDEFSSFAPASAGTNYWVEGSVRNDEDADLSNVEILFKCTEGVDTRVLVASIKLIPAGKTLKFKTKLFSSKYTVKLLDEEPEFKY